ncbi:MAG: bifunctional phosphopantothenoylcysteine decarboxylase/phosphopantothenate--cysteine ligase CoaBC, partial [Acidimicrobiia bacterium]|nr:bifunctional phosphopantothenoylcysteine decarboxylase/phosphopantothenate--cysteine ligase CoaBC [Acidimicrobiia bacterium]
DVSAPDAGFEHDTNRVLVLGPDGFEIEGSLMDKRAVARLVLDAVIDRRKAGEG